MDYLGNLPRARILMPRVCLAVALLAALLLPIAIAVLYGVSSLLGALGDASGALGAARFALACAVLWGVDLVALLLMLGANALLAGTVMGRDAVEDDQMEPSPREEE